MTAPAGLGDILRDDPDLDVARPERRMVILRRVDLWSALKLALALYSALFFVLFAGAGALWVAARHGGLIGNLENLIEDLGGYTPDSFHFKDGEIFRFTAVVGPILVVLGSLVTVAAVAVFNVVSRILGGVEVTVSDGDDGPGALERR